MFDTLSDRLDKVFTSLRGKGRLSDADIDATAREIRIALLEADVALPVVKAFIANVKERARGSEVSQALNPAQQVVKIVNEELVAILGGETRVLRFAKTPPTVIMLAGLQGAGKTTLAGKLAKHLKAAGHAPLLVACDLQRPNAVQQLQVVGGQAGVDVFAPYPGSGVGDPVDAARSGVEHARRMHHDVVVVDTAGRLGIDADMMQQAIDIRAAVSPDEVLFVVDAMIGQDAVVTAQAFQDGVGFTGVVLTKLDGDARGGAALSVRHLTGQPILFASTGEKLGDFDVFHPERMASRILGMGDVLTLIEQAEQHFDADQAERMAGKLMEGKDFDLEDFLEQMMQVKKMGSITSLLGMLPGSRDLLAALADYDLVGLQTEGDVDNLRRALLREVRVFSDADGVLETERRRLRLRPYPIGIDAAHFREAAERAATDTVVQDTVASIGSRRLLLGVDRLDYSKGVPERMEAFERFLVSNPDLRGRVTYLQIAPQSRTEVPEYAELNRQVNETVGRINGSLGDPAWAPINLVTQAYPRPVLAGLYRFADVCLVTPMRDGMNLVAKEYVAAQDETDPGVLVLSKFAGAAGQLSDALLVNPYDKFEMAEAMRDAIYMSLDERLTRWRGMNASVIERDIAWWTAAFLDDLGAAQHEHAARAARTGS